MDSGYYCYYGEFNRVEVLFAGRVAASGTVIMTLKVTG